MRAAAATITLPETHVHPSRDLTLPASTIETDCITANPGRRPESVTVTCRAGALQEVRICLTRDLQPRARAADTRRDCTGTPLMPAPH
ncbi:hypothetical protein [Paracoccus sp. (in: a-proteobacteria)]|uniref:hypothetical protein n=1 Tax=Paracoccus sp. TaxID=267 RepID=UPI00321F9F19